MDDDRLTLSPDYRPQPPKGGRRDRRRWEDLDSRLDQATQDRAYDPYNTPAPRLTPPRRSRPILTLFLIGLVLAALGYLAAPLLAFRAVRSAAQYGDTQALAELVDYNAVRQSLRTQLRPASAERGPPPDLLHDPIGALRRALEPVTPQADINPFLTPEALASLSMGHGLAGPKTPPSGGLFGGPIPAVRYWGFDRARLGVADPARPGRETVFTFEHRKTFEWRLAAVRLPEETR